MGHPSTNSANSLTIQLMVLQLIIMCGCDSINDLATINAKQLQQLVMDGLGMKTIPDMEQLNISQEEYYTKYAEYLSKTNHREGILNQYYDTGEEDDVLDGHQFIKKIFTFPHSNQLNSSIPTRKRRRRRSAENADSTFLNFELPAHPKIPEEVEESTLSIFLSNHNLPKEDLDENEDLDISISESIRAKGKKRREEKERREMEHLHTVQITQHRKTIQLFVFRLHDGPVRREQVFKKSVALPETEKDRINFNKWVQLDVNQVVNAWLKDRQLSSERHLSLEIVCRNCAKHGIKVFNPKKSSQTPEEALKHPKNPTLNLVGKVISVNSKKHRRNKKNSNMVQDYLKHPKKTACKSDEVGTCCRRKFMVNFKEVEGYQYIIQPLHFDAGYCEGNCPSGFHTANNHAYIQSFLHHKNKESIPNVCCSAQRLVDMEVLHVAPDDPQTLKVTTLKKMRVMKCSCG